jgi:hypothetical protein
MFYYCQHTFSPEDEVCSHENWLGGKKEDDRTFITGGHDRLSTIIKTYINFDIYAFMVSEYTRPNLTYHEDDCRAMTGIFERLERYFRGHFIYGLPETELSAALLWSPIGSSIRRLNPSTSQPLFPSWSWLGWIDHAAYPWQVEREYSIRTNHSPFRWKNACSEESNVVWFTDSEFRLPPDISLERLKTDWVAVVPHYSGFRETNGEQDIVFLNLS